VKHAVRVHRSASSQGPRRCDPASAVTRGEPLFPARREPLKWSTDLCTAAWTARPGTERYPINTRCGQDNVPSSFTARTFTVGSTRGSCAGGRLRCALQRDDGQMSPALVEVNCECESIARLSSDDREGLGAR
jgi:hypothetical protein